jgi:hypothetical protein
LWLPIQASDGKNKLNMPKKQEKIGGACRCPLQIRLGNDFDVPGLESDAEKVAPAVSQLYEPLIRQTPENFRGGESLGEIGGPESDLSDIEIPHAVKGVSRRRK